LILGFLAIGVTGVSAYSISEKIIKSLQAAIRPLNQFFFPKVIRSIKSFATPNMGVLMIIGRSTVLQLLALSFLVLLAFLIASYRDEFSILTGHQDFNLVYSLSAVMVFSVFIGVLNFMYGTIGLNHLNCKRYYANKILMTGLVSVSMSFLFVFVFKEYGAAYSFVISEFLLFIFVIKRYFNNAI
jgi:PST family polysaccharide transporter